MDKEGGKKWPERRRDHQTGHRQGERQAARDAKLRDEAAGIAGEGDEGLHPALGPAPPLPEPSIDERRRFFLRAGGQNTDAIAETGEAKTEVGILGHVPGIPATDLAQNLGAEMVGGAAERQRQAKSSEAWVQDIEQNRVFDREQPGQPGILDIVDREPRLQAGELAGGTQKTFRRLAQLARSRGVLGIEYDKEFAAHQRQGNVERARFGPRPAHGRDDDLVGGGQIQGGDCEPRRAIVVLDHELDVELAARIVPVLWRNCHKHIASSPPPNWMWRT